MRRVFEGLVLEVKSRTKKGTTEVYHRLVGYEFGDEFQDTIEVINVKAEQLAHVKTLVGKRCEIQCHAFTTASGYVMNNFVDAKVIQAV